MPLSKSSKIGESLNPSDATGDLIESSLFLEALCRCDRRPRRTIFAIDTVDTMQAAGGDSGKTEENKEREEQQRAVNPMSEDEAYAFIGSLQRVSKMYKIQAFNADFTKKMFGSYILNKLSRSDGDIREAVDLWCSDPAAAEEQYGHISKWDVSCVANMEGLFRDKNSFNEDIGAWDVSSVTTMKEMFYGARAFNQPLWLGCVQG